GPPVATTSRSWPLPAGPSPRPAPTTCSSTGRTPAAWCRRWPARSSSATATTGPRPSSPSPTTLPGPPAAPPPSPPPGPAAGAPHPAARRGTPPLFGLAATAPSPWDGRNPTLQAQIRGAIVSPLELTAAREPTERELEALAEFVVTLTPPKAEPGVDFDAAK